MNRDRFASMREQMSPSPAARAALEAALAAGGKRRSPVWRYAALTACALLLAAIWPLSRMVVQEEKWMLLTGSFQRDAIVEEAPRHSYESVDSGAVSGIDTGGGADGDTGASAAEDLPVNTGDLPGDAPSQEAAVSAYQSLMARFEAEYGAGCYPAWYGGAYIDENAGLIVHIVESCEPEDKSLYFQIWDWAGSEQVGFGSAKYSLSDLRSLQDRAFTAMSALGLAVGCGVNEETNQVELDISEATGEALRLLAELDPADDAIRVRVSCAAGMDLIRESAAPVQPGGKNTAPAG